MKKIMVVMLALAATMNLMAVTVNSRAKITMTCPGQTAITYVAEVAEYADGVDPSSTLLYDEGAQTSIYTLDSGNKYERIYAKPLKDYYLGFKTMTGVTDYTLTFTMVIGTISIYDIVADQTINVTEGGTYNFAATAGSTINDRFVINYVPSAPQICHRDGKLQVTGMKNSNVVVKNMDDSATKIGTVAITDDYQEITLKGVIAAGQYKVEYNDGTAHTVIIDVQ